MPTVACDKPWGPSSSTSKTGFPQGGVVIPAAGWAQRSLPAGLLNQLFLRPDCLTANNNSSQSPVLGLDPSSSLHPSRRFFPSSRTSALCQPRGDATGCHAAALFTTGARGVSPSTSRWALELHRPQPNVSIRGHKSARKNGSPWAFPLISGRFSEQNFLLYPGARPKGGQGYITVLYCN